MGLFDRFREFSPEKRKQLAQEGKALPDGSFPIVTVGDLKNAISAAGRASNRAVAIRHIKRRARALGATDQLPEDWSETKQEAEPMAEPETQEPQAEPIVAPVEELTQMRGEVDKATARALAAEKELADVRAREQAAVLKTEAESFKAIGIPIDEYIAKVGAIRATNPELATWVHQTLSGLDEAMISAGLLKEIGSSQGDDLDSIEKAAEKILVEQFKGDRSKYAEALTLAAKQFPKLAADYAAGG